MSGRRFASSAASLRPPATCEWSEQERGMAQVTVKCACCHQSMFCMSGRRGRAGMAEIAARLSGDGWSGEVLLGRGLCSDDCRALMARDVTPEIPAIESR
jgi:hypothetical protein